MKNQYDKDVFSSGPTFKKSWRENNKAFIEFDHAEEGLVLDNSLESEFELAGEDQIYHHALVENHGTHLELTSLDVENPRFLRYAYSDTSHATLFNSEGLHLHHSHLK